MPPPGLPKLAPPRRRPSRCSRRASPLLVALPTPPEDPHDAWAHTSASPFPHDAWAHTSASPFPHDAWAHTSTGPFPHDAWARTPDADQRVASPSEEYARMTLAEKVREASRALVHHWGRLLVGAAISELSDAAPADARCISAIDLPATFCIAPADEQLCPSDDPSRVIVVVSAAGRIVDTGVFDTDGPVFYRGAVIDNRYVP